MRRESFHRQQVTAAEKRARLATRLANTPPHMRGSLTPEGLAATTGVPVRECEYRLNLAQQRWANE
jgi:hypothetical protein